MENQEGLGPHFKTVFIPETRVSKTFAESFVYVENPSGSILHFCNRECTHEIDMHVRVKEGTTVDYEWLRAFVQVEKRKQVTNPIIIGYVVRGLLITVSELMTCPMPADNYDILIHADGTWERVLLVVPEDDVVEPYIKSLPKDVQEGFKAEAKAYWDNDHHSIHESIAISKRPMYIPE